jgi:hypothetical protein
MGYGGEAGLLAGVQVGVGVHEMGGLLSCWARRSQSMRLDSAPMGTASSVDFRNMPTWRRPAQREAGAACVRRLQAYVAEPGSLVQALGQKFPGEGPHDLPAPPVGCGKAQVHGIGVGRAVAKGTSERNVRGGDAVEGHGNGGFEIHTGSLRHRIEARPEPLGSGQAVQSVRVWRKVARIPARRRETCIWETPMCSPIWDWVSSSRSSSLGSPRPSSPRGRSAASAARRRAWRWA